MSKDGVSKNSSSKGKSGSTGNSDDSADFLRKVYSRGTLLGLQSINTDSQSFSSEYQVEFVFGLSRGDITGRFRYANDGSANTDLQSLFDELDGRSGKNDDEKILQHGDVSPSDPLSYIFWPILHGSDDLRYRITFRM